MERTLISSGLRWEDGNLKEIERACLHFNNGPRLCLGKDLPLMEESLGISHIIQAFPNVKLPGGEACRDSGTEKHA